MASLVSRHLSSYRNIAVNVLAFTTVFLTMLSWTMCYVEANEPADVRAWFELHSIPEDDLRQHNKDTASTSSSSSRTNTKHSIWKPVSQGWGIGDTIATVGRVFKYTIPKEAFRGDISRYEITEAGKDQLPSWLFYNGDSQTLEGIPSETDMDQYYITVIGIGKETNGSVSQATDVFSVSVVPDASGATAATPLQNGPVRGVKCSDDEPGVTATIVLDADWGKLGAKNRMESISKMSQSSRLGVDQFRLLPVGSKSIVDQSVLVAGPGNVKRAEHPGIALSWQIGCGTDAAKFPVVTILELSSKDGSMASKLGHNIIGWHVTNGKSKVKRVRRQANLMGTPMPTPTPTDMPIKPTATLVVPSTRVVPTQTSPSVMPSEIAPTRSFGVGETTMIMPTSGMIQPTPVPPMKNTIPFVNVPITRVEATEFEVFSYQVPKHTFADKEEGNTRKLRLMMITIDGEEISSDSWIQFNKQTQTMEGLPLKDNVGRQSYMLVAQDKMGGSVRLVFELVVKAAPKIAENPPAVTMGMVLDIDYDEFISNPEVRADILNKIASVFGDADASAITFTNIQRGSLILSWTNNTLPTDGCNPELVESIMSKLVGPDGQPTQELIDAFHPMKITSVDAIKTGPCDTTTNKVPYMTAPVSTAEPAGKGESSSNSVVTTVVPIIVVTLIIIVIICVVVIIHCRRSRKHKLAQEDQKTFSNKGIPIIFAEEREDPEKPPNSSSPLIMREEKPPISPPDYASPNKNNSRSKNSSKQNVPMVEISGSSPYKRPPPLATSTPDSRNQRPGKKPAYRAPPAYVPP